MDAFASVKLESAANSAASPFQQDYDLLATLRTQEAESSKTVNLVAMPG